MPLLLFYWISLWDMDFEFYQNPFWHLSRLYFFLCLINMLWLGFWNLFTCFTSSVSWGLPFCLPYWRGYWKMFLVLYCFFFLLCVKHIAYQDVYSELWKKSQTVAEDGNVLLTYSIKGERKAFQISEGRQYVQWFEGDLLG